MTSKQQLFDDLIGRVQRCQKCPRMDGRRRVLGYANGPLDALIMFVAEAPGRLGAERLGVPLSGDATGRNFETLLASGELRRERSFITNSVLCNPQAGNGTNSSPTLREVGNCVKYLGATIELVDPLLLVSLGTVALSALHRIAPVGTTLAESVGTAITWNGRTLVPLYHPAPRALIHRSLRQQKADYTNLRELLTVIARSSSIETDSP